MHLCLFDLYHVWHVKLVVWPLLLFAHHIFVYEYIFTLVDLVPLLLKIFCIFVVASTRHDVHCLGEVLFGGIVGH